MSIPLPVLSPFPRTGPGSREVLPVPNRSADSRDGRRRKAHLNTKGNETKPVTSVDSDTGWGKAGGSSDGLGDSLSSNPMEVVYGGEG